MVIKGIFTLAGAIDVLVFWIARKKTGAFHFPQNNWNAGETIELGLAVGSTGGLNTQNPAVAPLSRIQKVETFVRRHRQC